MTNLISQEHYNVSNYTSLLGKIPLGLSASIVMDGYYTPGDGGGGLFNWDSSSHTGTNTGTIIVPTGSTTGRWIRIFDGNINVKWFGAYGDNSHDDTIAIQSAINYCQGSVSNILFFPSGHYIITASTSATGLTTSIAMYISQTCQLRGEGLNNSFIKVNGPGTGILIEQVTGGSNCAILDINISGNSPMPRDLIVVHAPQTRIENIGISDCVRFGILIESGTVTGDTTGGLLGVSLAPLTTYLDSDQFFLNGIYGASCPSFVGQVTALTNSFVQPSVGGIVDVFMTDTSKLDSGIGIIIGASGETGGGYYGLSNTISGTHAQLINYGNPHGVAVGGTVANSSSVQIGAMIFCHGSDSESSIGQLVSGIDCNITILDRSLGGNVWIQCYSQDANIGYISGSSSENQFIKCGSEDYDAIIIQAGTSPPLLIGSVLSSAALNINSNAGNFSSIGGQNCGLSFSRNSVDGNINFQSSMPCAPFIDGNLELSTTQSGISSQWFHAYNYLGSGTYPYLNNTYLWKHLTNGVIDTDLYGGPFGWTENNNARGVGLAMIATPTMNTRRHWIWKQNVTVADGYNIVYLNGGISGDAGSVDFLDDATNVYPAGAAWPKAQRSVKFSIEYSNVDDLSAANCVVLGYCFIEKSVGPPVAWNAAANIYNNSGSSIALTLVWNFDVFITNYDSGNIG